MATNPTSVKIPCVYIGGRKASPLRGNLVIDFSIVCILCAMSFRSQPLLKECVRFLIPEHITHSLSKSVWGYGCFLIYLSDILFNSHNHVIASLTFVFCLQLSFSTIATPS